MIKWFFILLLIGIPIIVFSTLGFQEKEVKTELRDASIMKIISGSVEELSLEEKEDKVLNVLKELTEEEAEILMAFKLPTLERNEKMINFGIRISTQYNNASYEYSSGDITDREYYKMLFNLREYYEAYMTFTDTYVGEGDVLIQKKSMIQELGEIEKQIILLKSSEKFEPPEYLSEQDKYKKFLPSMFTP